jgi:hypothetical protein
VSTVDPLDGDQPGGALGLAQDTLTSPALSAPCGSL